MTFVPNEPKDAASSKVKPPRSTTKEEIALSASNKPWNLFFVRLLTLIGKISRDGEMWDTTLLELRVAAQRGMDISMLSEESRIPTFEQCKTIVSALEKCATEEKDTEKTKKMDKIRQHFLDFKVPKKQ